MKRYLYYLVLYSILGFILERVINLFAFGYPLDNSVLVGPWQPLYGSGIVLAIVIYEQLIKRVIPTHFLKLIALLIVAIITTALSEAFTGYGNEILTGDILWNYNAFFTCQSPFVCLLPTTLFGFGSFLTILLLHPFIASLYRLTPKYITYLAFLLFFVDSVYTIIRII
ncbi:MAG: putative ABC transporter permease [Candidatus Izimaplasma sp.]|nr:putative ABC transporter permease [Candidatus Izimaplasma bacterium]